MAHADGKLDGTRISQFSRYMVRGEIVGAGSVVLADNLAGQFFTQYGFAYIVTARVIVQNTATAGTPSSQYHVLTVHQDTSGFAVIDQDTQVDVFAGGGGGTVAFSVTGADANIVATLTGTDSSALVVYEWAELNNGNL
jgi:hypothetical protein